MKKSAIVRARVDSSLKLSASVVLMALGYTLSDLVREAFHFTVKEARFPFDQDEQRDLGLDSDWPACEAGGRSDASIARREWLHVQCILTELLEEEERQPQPDPAVVLRIRSAIAEHKRNRWK
jgi:antitoxin component of RelBE/YafQ-DinJ toxin-antitoxin module